MAAAAAGGGEPALHVLHAIGWAAGWHTWGLLLSLTPRRGSACLQQLSMPASLVPLCLLQDAEALQAQQRQLQAALATAQDEAAALATQLDAVRALAPQVRPLLPYSSLPAGGGVGWVCRVGASRCGVTRKGPAPAPSHPPAA